MKGLAALALCKLCHRNAGPFGHNSCNLILCHTLMNQAQIFLFNLLFLCLQLLLQLGQLSILKLCRLVQIVFLLGILDLAVYSLNLFTESREAVYAGFFIFPLSLFCGKFIMQLCQLLL